MARLARLSRLINPLRRNSEVEEVRAMDAHEGRHSAVDREPGGRVLGQEWAPKLSVPDLQKLYSRTDRARDGLAFREVLSRSMTTDRGS